MSKQACSISVIHVRFMTFSRNKDKWSMMTLRYKSCLSAVNLFEDHGIKMDRAERLFVCLISVFRPFNTF